MKKEIERKWLVKEKAGLYFRKPGIKLLDIYQKYLSENMRIRKVKAMFNEFDENYSYYCTYKTPVNDIVRNETEFEIDENTFKNLNNNTLNNNIWLNKIRMVVPDNFVFDAIETRGDESSQMIYILEKEFGSEDEARSFRLESLEGFDTSLIIKEVTNDENYLNCNIAKKMSEGNIDVYFE